MKLVRVCEQSACVQPARWRMYWPGSPHSFICDEHRKFAIEVADACGFGLTVEALDAPPAGARLVLLRGGRPS